MNVVVTSAGVSALRRIDDVSTTGSANVGPVVADVTVMSPPTSIALPSKT